MVDSPRTVRRNEGNPVQCKGFWRPCKKGRQRVHACTHARRHPQAVAPCNCKLSGCLNNSASNAFLKVLKRRTLPPFPNNNDKATTCNTFGPQFGTSCYRCCGCGGSCDGCCCCVKAHPLFSRREDIPNGHLPLPKERNPKTTNSRKRGRVCFLCLPEVLTLLVLFWSYCP